jgi:hypothetical protein
VCVGVQGYPKLGFAYRAHLSGVAACMPEQDDENNETRPPFTDRETHFRSAEDK